MRPLSDQLVLSSEHGSNVIPAVYASLFVGEQETLQSHRGWDIGSAEMARYLAKNLDVSLNSAPVSRLLVDCNRSPHHRQLFSEFTRGLPSKTRESILQRYYYSYRDKFEELIRKKLSKNSVVVHVSVHSFVPELNGQKRNADIGLLYDPQRKRELKFCRYWQDRLQESNAQLTVRRNYPYKGTSDGFVTHLRRVFPPQRYVAIELEVRHDWSLAGPTEWTRLKRQVVTTLQQTMQNCVDMR